jgi:hypothetical protein
MTPAEPRTVTETSRPTWIPMVAAVGVVGLIGIAWAQFGGELIPVRDGIGYDGASYAAITRQPMRILQGEVFDHHVQRALPSLLVHFALWPFGLAQSDPAIIVGFQVLNYLLIAFACPIWADIARRWKLGEVGTWFGFIALFVNYAVLKFPAYYPVLTDAAGFALGVALLWCVVADRRGLMYCVSVLGAVTWPLVFYSGLLLLSLRRQPILERRDAARSSLFVGAAMVVAGMALYGWWRNLFSKQLLEWLVPHVLPLSVVVMFWYVIHATRPLLALWTPKLVIRAVNWPGLAISIATVLVAILLQASVSTPSDLSVTRTLSNILAGGIQKPGVFLVSNIAYFGPAVVAVALLWRRVVGAVSAEGLAAVVLITGYVLLSVGAESRIFMSMWPFFAGFAAKAVDALSWNRNQVAGFAAVALVTSRLWLPIQIGHTSDGLPGVIYRASIGWRMPIATYLIMAAAGAVVAWFVWLLLNLSGPPRGIERAEVSGRHAKET